MAKLWESACAEYIPKTRGNRDNGDTEQIRVFYRPFAVGEYYDHLDDYRRKADVFTKAATAVQKAEKNGKPTKALLEKMKAAERAVFDLCFARIDRVTRGPLECRGMDDLADTVYPDRMMAQEIANHITESGGVTEEERPT